ncbi:MAG: Hsp20 family protein [Alphaproteobacteria bacterium]|nr:Hsp20 family protein [Alphaproteobacteria bacterium]
MARLTLFNSPMLLGFDEIERTLDRLTKSATDGYPPYNIEQLDDDRMRITLAVAGFAGDDLSVVVEDNQLIIRGKQKDEESERVFLHRGIAARHFQRAFVVADGIEVVGASLDNGLLHVDLVRPKAQSTVRSIPIKTGEGTKVRKLSEVAVDKRAS